MRARVAAANDPNRAVDLYRRCLDMLRERAPTEASLQVRFGVYLASAYSELGAADRAARRGSASKSEAIHAPGVGAGNRGWSIYGAERS
jgi:hypothetical protein